MKLADYVRNPFGIGTTFSNISILKNAYNDRYATLMKNHNIGLKIYYTNSNQTAFYHFTIKSETERNNTYDVLLQFISSSVPTTFIDMDMKVFSNCPSFVFTYGYVFKQHGVLIEGTEKKLGQKIIGNAAKTTNPNNIIGFEKSIYYATKYLTENPQYLVMDSIKTIGKQTTFSKILSNIRPFKVIEVEIQKENEKLAYANRTISRSTNDNVITPQNKDKQKISKGVNRIKPSGAIKSGVTRVKKIGK